MTDTYHDHLTDQDVAEMRYPTGLEWLVDFTVRNLLERSGANNVTSGVLRCDYDPCGMIMRYAVSFDSKRWTGLA